MIKTRLPAFITKSPAANLFSKFGWLLLVLYCCAALLKPSLLRAQEKVKRLSPTQQDSRILENLQAKTEVDFVETPLTEVMSFLSGEYDIPILIDKTALDDLGTDITTPITDQFNGISGVSALRRLLRPQGLTTVVKHGVLLITTPEEAETQLLTKTYDVADLVSEAVGDEAPAISADSLIDTVTAIITPDSWDEVGGPGAIHYFRGLLTISQTGEVQEQVAGLLKAFRSARQIAQASGFEAPAVFDVRSVVGNRASEDRIYAALELPVDLDVLETPLDEVVQFVRELLDINVLIDARPLGYLGLDPNTLVTFRADRLPLKSVLTLLLKELELTFMVRDESLVITTPEESETQPVTHCYPVLDLVADARRAADIHDTAAHDYDSLIELVTATVSSDAWDEVGGPGAIAGLDGVLIVSQTREVHEQILDLLAQMRTKLLNRPAENAAQKFDPHAMKLVAYRVHYPPRPKTPKKPAAKKPAAKKPAAKDQSQAAPPTGSPILARFAGGGHIHPDPVSYTPDELLGVVSYLVDPESWRADGAYIHAVSDMLLIRQTPAVHKKIRKLFEKLGVQGFAKRSRCVFGCTGF